MAHQVFICHSAKDKQIADAACATLEAQRIRCWIAPRDVLGGAEYMAELDTAIADCSIFLMIFSQKAMDSQQVRREIERAISYQKIILPFRIEDVGLDSFMRYAIGSVHWLDAFTPPMEARIMDLCSTISTLLTRQSEKAPGMQAPAQIEPQLAASMPVVEQPEPEIPDAQTANAPPRRNRMAQIFILAVVLIIIATAGGLLWRHFASPQNASKPSLELQCNFGNAQACFDLGSQYDFGINVPIDRQKAATLLQKACDGGSADGCSNLSILYYDGTGVPKDLKKSIGLLQKACDGGSGRGCYGLAGMYENGDGVTKDHATALDFYKKACHAGIGCNMVKQPAPETASGNLYQQGIAAFNRKDYSGARPLLQQARTQGEAGACGFMGILYDEGDGVVRNAEKASSFYQKACNGGDLTGCSNLGFLYEKGNGISKDLSKATALYVRACDGNNAIGCSYLAAFYYNGIGVPESTHRETALSEGMQPRLPGLLRRT